MAKNMNQDVIWALMILHAILGNGMNIWMKSVFRKAFHSLVQVNKPLQVISSFISIVVLRVKGKPGFF